MFIRAKTKQSIMKTPAKRGQKPPGSKSHKAHSHNATARVSSFAGHYTLGRTKALLEAALRVWELKHRLSVK